MNELELQNAVAGAVRAEMARAQKRPSELVEVLGLSRPTVYGRMSGAYPFTVPELDKVARFIGITAQDILDSAALGESFKDARPVAIRPLPMVDAWAQPPGSHRRRRQPGQGMFS